MSGLSDTWADIVSTLQLPLQIPSILVAGAEGAASKVTGAPAPKIPQAVVNAATGQTAPYQDVVNALPQLPDIQLPDFSLSNITGSFADSVSSIEKYALIGGAALLVGYLVMRPNPAPSRRR